MKKLLRFKDFSLMLEELLFEEKKSKPTGWHVKLREAYLSLFGANQYFIDPSGKKEIMRADFILGKIGESEDNLINFLSTAAKLREDQYEIEEVGVGGAGSGSFPGFIVKFKENIDWFGKALNANEEYYIVNAKKTVNLGGEATSALIGDKQTTPSALGLNGYWPNKDSIIVAAKTEVNSRIANADCQRFMNSLIDLVAKWKGNVTNAKETMKFKEEKYKINIDLKEYIDLIDSVSINNIQKDFGEVLGGIFMFSLVKGFVRGLEFPIESNTELVDFYFDGISISSKAGSRGAKASVTGYKNAIEKQWKESNYTPTPIEQEVKDFLDILTEDAKEPKNTEYLKSAGSSSIFSGSINLFDRFLSSGKNRWTYFRNYCSDPVNTINRDTIIKVFVDQRNNNDGSFHEFIQGIVSAGYKGADKEKEKEKGRDAILTEKLLKSRNDEDAKEWFDVIMKEDRGGRILVGLIVYYCSADLKQLLNAKYGKTLSEMINKAVKVNQLMLSIKIKTDYLIFTIKPMSYNEFELGTLNGIATWGTKKMTISMK
jgi:hypothetical protein